MTMTDNSAKPRPENQRENQSIPYTAKAFTPETWFPSPVWARQVPNHEQINAGILDVLAQLEKSSGDVSRSNVGGWHSATNLHTNSDLKEIRRIIGNACVGCANYWSFNFDMFDLHFQEMWLNKNGPSDFNKAHVHPNAMFSGAYYVKVPDNSGNIEFYDPVRERVMNIFPVTERTRLNTQAMEYKGAEGLILIFPGWLQHSVQPNRSNDFRISISFNMGFRRKA